MIIKLNKNFYSLNAINTAIEVFKEIINAETQEEKEYYKIIIQKKTKISDEELKNEFCNYCIGMMK